jgi:hypothetical protein
MELREYLKRKEEQISSFHIACILSSSKIFRGKILNVECSIKVKIEFQINGKNY